MKKAEQLCPHCGELLDTVQEISGQDIEPTPGDFSICVSCANFLIYDDKLELSKLSDSDEIALDVLDQLTAVKFQIEFGHQSSILGAEFQKILRSTR
jgi:hypothetical protein